MFTIDMFKLSLLKLFTPKKILLNKYSITSIISAFSKIFFLPIIYTYLTIEEIGFYDFLLSSFIFFESLVYFSVKSAIYRFSFGANKLLFKKFISLSTFVGIFVIYFFLIHYTNNNLLIILLTLWFFSMCWFNILNEHIRERSYNNSLYVKFNSLQIITYVFFPFLAFYNNLCSLEILIICITSSYFVSILFLLTYLLFKIKFIRNNKTKNNVRIEFRKVLKFIVPIALSAIIYRFYHSSFRMVIQNEFGLVENGNLALISYIPNMLIYANTILLFNLQDFYLKKINVNVKNIFYQYNLVISICIVLSFFLSLCVLNFYFNFNISMYFIEILFLFLATYFSCLYSFCGVILFINLKSVKIFQSTLILIVVFYIPVLIIQDISLRTVYFLFMLSMFIAFIHRYIFQLRSNE